MNPQTCISLHYGIAANEEATNTAHDIISPETIMNKYFILALNCFQQYHFLGMEEILR